MNSIAWTVTEDGTISGIKPGTSLRSSPLPLPLEAFTVRPFESGSERVMRYIDREGRLEFVTESRDKILRVMCFPPSKLELPNGKPVFQLERQKIVNWIEQTGRVVIPDADGFFHTEPECFGGRYYKRELVVFTLSLPNVTKIVLDLLAD